MSLIKHLTFAVKTPLFIVSPDSSIDRLKLILKGRLIIDSDGTQISRLITNV